ncbi:glycosyltransferase 61 family protein, partial [Escherichia coli]|uniref:glycosyltransferase 61 family protein n=1 Tax=Escherichia coli TaxID=562 RepID=UPI003CFD744D
QVRVFHNAKVVIGATGAQMANVIFMKPGTVAIEICPSNYSGIWIRNLCYLAKIQWCSHYFPSPIVELPHSPWLFSYRINVDQFMNFVSEFAPSKPARFRHKIKIALTRLGRRYKAVVD